MPCFYSHYTFARSLLPRLPDKARAAVKAYGDDYMLGAQGPDPFLYLIVAGRYKRYSELGDAFHKQSAGLGLRKLCEASLARDSARAYCLGYLAHYALDCAAHPYIMSRICGDDHTRFETQLDAAYAAHNGENARRFRPVSALPESPNAAKRVSFVWQSAAQEIADVEDDDVFLHAFYAARRALSLVYDPMGLKRPIASLAGTLSGTPRRFAGYLYSGTADGGIDFLNLGKDPWRAPWAPDAERRESYPELVEIAAADALRMMNALAAAWNTGALGSALAAIGARDFGTGLEGAQPAKQEPDSCVFGSRCANAGR